MTLQFFKGHLMIYPLIF